MQEFLLNEKDKVVMKLLHYFITEAGYNPVVLHGAQNEIWLENLESEYKVIRIVSKYIHNNDQLELDLFRSKKIVKSIKNKTFSFNVNTLSIFTDLGDNVKIKDDNNSNFHLAYVKEIKDLNKYKFIVNQFPNIITKAEHDEKDVELFVKLTSDLDKNRKEENSRAEEVFKRKKTFVANLLIGINVAVFLFMYLYGGSGDINTLVKFGANASSLVTGGEYWRIITSGFLHNGLFHLLLNCYALYILGNQVENFFGPKKFAIIYFASLIAGSLTSLIFLPDNGISVGASGAIFGLFGALLYFGYYYRVYLGSALKLEIIPIVIMNLILSIVVPGIDLAAHVGGIIGGVLITMAVGLKYKSNKLDYINGIILLLMFFGFLVGMVLFYK